MTQQVGVYDVGSLTSRKFPVRIIEVLWRERRPFEVMPGREFVLHEAWRVAVKVVRRRRLVERRRLLVRWEGATEVWRALHAEGRLPLTPWRLIGLVAPRRLIVLPTPGRRRLVLVAPGAPAVSRAAPAGFHLVPHALVTVPGWTGRGSLTRVERGLRRTTARSEDVRRLKINK